MKQRDRNNAIASFIRDRRKAAKVTQKQFSIFSGLGLHFIRDLEQGKTTLRMDKVNEALGMFGYELVPGKKEETKKGRKRGN